jgi:hypothetical protein
VGEPRIAVKIGMLAQTGGQTLKQAILRRLRQVQSSNHEAVELLGVVLFTEGKYPTRLAEVKERELHIQFAHLQRFKAHTRGAEWFTCAPEILDTIRDIAISPDLLGLPRYACTPRD